MAKIHPYKGYLNTKFNLYTNGSDVVAYRVSPIEDTCDMPLITGKISPNIPHSISINEPGVFLIEFSDGTSTEIIVEDGYKFGGSAYKQSFIFDETPWCFVIMNDRTYFYNRNTGESYVEVISPDTIKVISPDYVLFKNEGQDEMTIYSMVDQRPIINITNILYYSNEVIVWKEITCENCINLKIYSLHERIVVKSIRVDKYIIDEQTNTLIYIDNNRVFKQSLSTPLKENQEISIYGQFISLVAPNIIVSVDKPGCFSNICVKEVREDKVISRFRTENTIYSINSDIVFDIPERINVINDFDISQIGCEGVKIKLAYDSFVFYSTEWDLFCLTKEHCYESGIYTYNKSTIYKVKSLFTGKEFLLNEDVSKVVIKNGVICFSNNYEVLIFGKYIESEYLNCVNTYNNGDEVVCKHLDSYFVLDNKTGWKKLGGKNLSFKYFDEFGIIKNEDENVYFNLSGCKFDGYAHIDYRPSKHLVLGDKIIVSSGTTLPNLESSVSESGKLCLAKEEDGIFLMINNNGNVERKKILLDVFDSSFYESVLLSEDGSQIMYRDADKTIILDIQNNTSECFDNVSYIKDVNGIRPHFSHGPGSLKPRLVNPVTGQIITHGRMTSYHFVSPNRSLYADTELEKYVEKWNLITNSLLSESQLAYFNDKLNYWVNSVNHENENNRRLFIEENISFFRNECEKRGWRKRPDKQLVNGLLRLSYIEFCDLFIRKRGIAIIRYRQDDSIVAKIDLGEPLWFLNYVSFSYDNRFVAIAGRYPNDSNFGGLFLVYDLINKKEIIAKRNSWAVWMTSFNQENIVAAYSSEPISYKSELSKLITHINVESYPDFNFLTFSPDGKYTALSNQGYVAKYDKHGRERSVWGHMPSCIVYVVCSSDFGNVLLEFSDLSKSGIEGLSDRYHNCSKTVSSVSFSNDNHRLMMVGNDGVVVIRNLHL